MRERLAAGGAIVVLAGALAAGPALADFSAGLDAYERGEYATALAQWRPLAEGGVVEAQYNLGLMHYDGRGVPRDAAAAHAWFLRAAEGGYARAQYRVAEMFESGDGVRKDLVQAHLWFRLAGEQKEADARKRRRKLAKKMTPEQIAYADMLARHWLRDRRAADR
jgi:TPR repeat protein